MKAKLVARVVLAIAVSASLITFVNPTAAADITGAGSTFVYPVLSKWSDTYHGQTGTKINYQSIGSGGGIAQIKAGTVTFGASDKPLSPQELQNADLGQFPLVVGGVVPVVNLPNVHAGQLRFTGALLADIFLGKVTQWNDPAIVAVNPGVQLPASAIAVVHRSDGSGTTFNWTNYLSKVSSVWKSKVGEGTAVEWPVGIGGKGNEGVAAYVKQIGGAIGYVELAYAAENQMSYTSVQNKAGKYIDPTATSFQAAASGADWTAEPDFYQVITDAKGDSSWPIAATVFVLMHKHPADVAATKSALDFFDWVLEHGQPDAQRLNYVPLPDGLVEQIKRYWIANFASGK